jgi:hypothetical protein
VSELLKSKELKEIERKRKRNEKVRARRRLLKEMNPELYEERKKVRNEKDRARAATLRNKTLKSVKLGGSKRQYHSWSVKQNMIKQIINNIRRSTANIYLYYLGFNHFNNKIYIGLVIFTFSSVNGDHTGWTPCKREGEGGYRLNNFENIPGRRRFISTTSFLSAPKEDGSDKDDSVNTNENSIVTSNNNNGEQSDSEDSIDLSEDSGRGRWPSSDRPSITGIPKDETTYRKWWSTRKDESGETDESSNIQPIRNEQSSNQSNKRAAPVGESVDLLQRNVQNLDINNGSSKKRKREDDSDQEDIKKVKKESPLDYVLEKQDCEMPDINDSDGGD